MTFGERLLITRLEKELTQTQLATLIGSKQQNINQWENDEKVPRAEKIIALSRALDVSTDYLLKGEIDIDEEQPPKENWLEDKSYKFLILTDDDTNQFVNLLLGTKNGQKILHYMANAYYSYNGIVSKKDIDNAIKSAKIETLIPLFEKNKTQKEIIYYALMQKFTNAFEIWTKREDKKE